MNRAERRKAARKAVKGREQRRAYSKALRRGLEIVREEKQPTLLEGTDGTKRTPSGLVVVENKIEEAT